MWDILVKDEDFEKYIGKKVFVRFEVDPKGLTCRGNVEKFLQYCADRRNELKDGFYLLTKDGDDRKDHHRFLLDVGDEGSWSARHSFIKEIYGLKG